MGFRSKKVFFWQFLVDILPLGSRSGSRKPKSCGSNGSGSPSTVWEKKKVFRFFLSHWSTKKSYKFSKNIEESCTNRVQFCTKRRKSDIFRLTLYYKMSYLQRVLFIQIIYLKWFLFTTWWGHSLFYKSLSETNMSLELSLVLLLISFLCFEPIHLLEEVIDFLSFRLLALSCI